MVRKMTKSARDALNARDEANWRRAFNHPHGTDDEDDDGYFDRQKERDLWMEEDGTSRHVAFAERSASNRDPMPSSKNQFNAPSPMKPLKPFLFLGTALGAFPAVIRNTKAVMGFSLTARSCQSWYSAAFFLLWLGWGLAVAIVCQTEAGEGISSVFDIKDVAQTEPSTPSEMDRILLHLLPFLSLIFLFAATYLNWSRVRMLSDLCREFAARGFPLGTESPEAKTLAAFVVNLVVFMSGQVIDVVRRGIAFCPDPDKKTIFIVCLSIWVLPLYIMTVFSGTLFLQLSHTLAEYLEEMGEEIAERNAQAHRKNAKAREVIVKQGLPRRYDRLHNCIPLLDGAYSAVCLNEVAFLGLLAPFMLYLSMSAILDGGRNDVFPWWAIGYALLAVHHLLRIHQLCQAGSAVSRELERVLTMLAQFAFIHGSNDLMCLAIARRPQSIHGSLSVGGFAPLERGISAKAILFAIVGAAVLMHFRLTHFYHDSNSNTVDII